MASNRFSKTLLLDDLEFRIDRIMREYRFDPNNGTAQLKGSSVDRILAYGQLEAMRNLRDSILGGYIGS